MSSSVMTMISPDASNFLMFSAAVVPATPLPIIKYFITFSLFVCADILKFSPPERQGFSASTLQRVERLMQRAETYSCFSERVDSTVCERQPLSGQDNREGPSLSMFFAALVSASI